MNGIHIPLLATGIMVSVLVGITLLAQNYSLNGIKSKTVGDGQHGTARWATKAEIRRTYCRIPFTPQRWQAMASVMSTALSRLNAFLDSELEQLLCFDTEIDAEQFCSQKCAIFSPCRRKILLRSSWCPCSFNSCTGRFWPWQMSMAASWKTVVCSSAMSLELCQKLTQQR